MTLESLKAVFIAELKFSIQKLTLAHTPAVREREKDKGRVKNTIKRERQEDKETKRTRRKESSRIKLVLT